MKPIITSILIVASFGNICAAQTSAKDSEWTNLLADNSMVAWQPYQPGGSLRNWKLGNDGVLHINGDAGDIVTREKFDYFDLTWDWKIAQDGNSGVLYQVRMGDKKAWHSGPEYQLIDNRLIARDKKPTQATAALYGLVAPARAKLNPPGEWNSSRIRVNKKLIEHWLNGKRVVAINPTSSQFQQLVKASKFGKYPQFAIGRKGHICLQDHRTETWFRNIKIRRLD